MSPKVLEKRLKLKELSILARTLIKTGFFDGSINECVINFYKQENPDIDEFNTFIGWKLKGFNVLKGSVAFPIWGCPLKKNETINVKNKDEKISDDLDFTFFPICNLFSNTQVVKCNEN